MTKIGQWTTGLLLIATATLPAYASTLYGITGEAPAATVSETLYRLSQSDASSTFVLSPGAAADGEALAYNPTDGKMYRWSGNNTNIMESIDLASGVVTNIPQSGAAHKEALSATWDAAHSRFIVVTNYNYQVFSVTPGGVYAFIGAPPANLKGVAFADGNLYAVESNAANIYTLDPSTAAISTPQPVTAPGIAGTISGFNGLATDPSTGALWAILRIGGGVGNPGTRYLGTITPGGVFRSVGILGDAFSSIAFVGTPGPITQDGPFQVRYASNLTQGDSVVNITNTGANGNNLYGPGFGTPDGNICVNVYAFSPDEQMISCCSCLVTPNGLVHVTANNDLVSNTLTGVRPNSIVIKLVATATGTETHHHSGQADTQDPSYSGSDCTNSAALAGTRSFPVTDAGMLAWGTTLHSASNNDPPTGSSFAITETPFLPATLDPTRLTERNIDGDSELASLASRCTNIIGNGSSFGICRSCRLGGLGGAKQ